MGKVNTFNVFTSKCANGKAISNMKAIAPPKLSDVAYKIQQNSNKQSEIIHKIQSIFNSDSINKSISLILCIVFSLSAFPLIAFLTLAHFFHTVSSYCLFCL